MKNVTETSTGFASNTTQPLRPCAWFPEDKSVPALSRRKPGPHMHRGSSYFFYRRASPLRRTHHKSRFTHAPFPVCQTLFSEPCTFPAQATVCQPGRPAASPIPHKTRDAPGRLQHSAIPPPVPPFVPSSVPSSVLQDRRIASFPSSFSLFIPYMLSSARSPPPPVAPLFLRSRSQVDCGEILAPTATAATRNPPPPHPGQTRPNSVEGI